MKKEYGLRVLFYLMGLLVLAAGLTLNTKAGLGVSPIISVAYSVSVIAGQNFGDMTFILYGVFVVAEMAIHLIRGRKAGWGKLWPALLKDALQFPLSLVFTRFLNVFSGAIPDFAGAGMAARLLVLACAIACTGVGAALSLNMQLIPNPGDGIVQAVAGCIGRSVGFTKNCVDLCSICVTCILGLTLAREIVGIGLGTVLAMAGVGRVIALFNHFTYRRILEAAGLAPWKKA